MNKQWELCHAQVEDKHVNKVVWELWNAHKF